MPSQRRRFNLASLLILIVVVVFGISVLLPGLNRARETANKVSCACHLKQIGMAIQLYANDNGGYYPRTKYEGGDVVIPNVSNAGFDSPHQFTANSAVPANCVPSALFLLLRTQDITSLVFVCPSTYGRPDPFSSNDVTTNTAQNRGNFTDLKANLGYSYANPYPDNGAIAKGYNLSTGMDPGFAVIADLNPGLAGGSTLLSITTSSSLDQMARANSHNHAGSGINILFADGHVEFDGNPLQGLNHDNIYCRGMGGPGSTPADIVNSPIDANDSVMLPVESP